MFTLSLESVDVHHHTEVGGVFTVVRANGRTDDFT